MGPVPITPRGSQRASVPTALISHVPDPPPQTNLSQHGVKGRVTNRSCWRHFVFITFHIKARSSRPWHVPHHGSAAASCSPLPESPGSSLVIFRRWVTHQPLNSHQHLCCSLRHPFLLGTTGGNGAVHLPPPQTPRSTSPGPADLITLSSQDKALQEVTNSPTTRS